MQRHSFPNNFVKLKDQPVSKIFSKNVVSYSKPISFRIATIMKEQSYWNRSAVPKVLNRSTGIQVQSKDDNRDGHVLSIHQFQLALSSYQCAYARYQDFMCIGVCFPLVLFLHDNYKDITRIHPPRCRILTIFPTLIDNDSSYDRQVMLKCLPHNQRVTLIFLDFQSSNQLLKCVKRRQTFRQ